MHENEIAAPNRLAQEVVAAVAANENCPAQSAGPDLMRSLLLTQSIVDAACGASRQLFGATKEALRKRQAILVRHMVERRLDDASSGGSPNTAQCPGGCLRHFGSGVIQMLGK